MLVIDGTNRFEYREPLPERPPSLAPATWEYIIKNLYRPQASTTSPTLHPTVGTPSKADDMQLVGEPVLICIPFIAVLVALLGFSIATSKPRLVAVLLTPVLLSGKYWHLFRFVLFVAPVWQDDVSSELWVEWLVG
jgi:hypothetical protein